MKSKKKLKLHPAIMHMNATPKFMANPKNVKMINKMVELASKMSKK